MTTLLAPLRDSEDVEHVHRRPKSDERKLKKKEKKEKEKSRGDGDGEKMMLQKKKKKRKSFDADVDSGSDIAAPAARVGAAPSPSQPPKKKKKRPPKKSAAAFAASLEAAATISTAPAEEQAAWLWSSAEETLKLSAAELAGLDASKVLPLPSPPSSSSSSPAGSSPTLEERLAAADPELAAELTRWSPPTSSSFPSSSSSSSSSAAAAAAPLLLALSPSANNCLACISSLPRTSSNSFVAKLFARHIKVGEQEALLRANAGRARAAAGTPARVDALATAASGNDDNSKPPSLDLSKLKLLVLDVSLDAKQRTLLDIPETRGDTWGLFGRHLMERVRSGECRVALFDSGAKGKLTAPAVPATATAGGWSRFRNGGRGGGGSGGRGGFGGRGRGGGGRGRF